MKEETFLTLFLSAVLLLYMLLGGFLFQFLESENEAKSIERYVELFTRLQTKNNISMDLMYQIVQTHEQACEIGQESQENRKWDFVGSFYFSGTVITTIGFGHASPSTFFGQLALIVFALTSIPLYVLFMNVLLERIITLLKNFLNKLYMILPTNDFIKRHDVHTLPISRILTMVSVIFILTVSVCAFAFAHFEDWTYFEGFYFVIVAFTTIGLGDFVPSKFKSEYNFHPVYQIINWCFIMFGVVITYIALNLAATQIKLLLHDAAVKLSVIPCIIVSNDKPKNTSDASQRISARASIISVHDDGIGLGSFAAIQKAIDRIRLKAENCDAEGKSELKAVNTIEAILQNEYRKVQKMQGTDPASKWRRAAARARITARRKQSNVYKSVLVDNDCNEDGCITSVNQMMVVMPKFEISCLKESFNSRPRRPNFSTNSCAKNSKSTTKENTIHHKEVRKLSTIAESESSCSLKTDLATNLPRFQTKHLAQISEPDWKVRRTVSRAGYKNLKEHYDDNNSRKTERKINNEHNYKCNNNATQKNGHANKNNFTNEPTPRCIDTSAISSAISTLSNSLITPKINRNNSLVSLNRNNCNISNAFTKDNFVLTSDSSIKMSSAVGNDRSITTKINETPNDIHDDVLQQRLRSNTIALMRKEGTMHFPADRNQML